MSTTRNWPQKTGSRGREPPWQALGSAQLVTEWGVQARDQSEMGRSGLGVAQWQNSC